MTKARILVVDDDPEAVVFLVDQLGFFGYDTVVARNGPDGLRQAQQSRPNLIILDVMMPGMSGYEVSKQLKSNPQTAHIPILMLTAKGQPGDPAAGFDSGADDYIAKPHNIDELDRRVKALLRRPVPPPYLTAQDHCFVTFSCQPGRPVGIRVSGMSTFSTTTKHVLDLDVDAFARHADNAPCLDWRFSSRVVGKQLYQLVLASHHEALGIGSQVLGEVGDPGKLHFRFESSRDLLRVPFEFLFDEGIHADGEYLVLKQPLSRCIAGIHVKRTPPAPAFFNDLQAKGQPLSVLLIASNTWPPLPGVDREIETLDSSLKTLFGDRGIPIQVKAVPSIEATYDMVRKEVRKCPYHILHYAGHGLYDRQSPEKSSLFFWEHPNCQGGVKRMPISELNMLLRGSDLRFAYLSCCVSTKAGEPAQLLDDDLLGLADGLVHAGVPSALGFRWPVSDRGAQDLALTFYQSLAQQGQLDSALLDARCEIAARDRDDITWLSPILILQA